MRLFKKKSGLNPLDAPSRRNMTTKQNTSNRSVISSSMQKKPSSKVSGQNVQGMNNTLGYEHGNDPKNKQKRNAADKSNKEQSPKKKKGWFKVLRRKSKLKGNKDTKIESQTSPTQISPAVSRTNENPINKYFSMPTQGFECILDANDLENVNIQNNTCSAGALVENLQVGAAGVCSDASSFYDWESFVTLLTTTNQTLITTIYDANETIKGFLEEGYDDDNDDEGNSVGKKSTTVGGSSRNGRTGQLSKREIPKKVKFNFSKSLSLPFDEIDTEKETFDGTNAVEKSITNGVESLSTASAAPPNNTTKDGMSFQNVTKKQQMEKINVAMTNNQQQDQEKKANSSKPVVMPYEVPNLKAPMEEVFDSSFTLSFLQVRGRLEIHIFLHVVSS